MLILSVRSSRGPLKRITAHAVFRWNTLMRKKSERVLITLKLPQILPWRKKEEHVHWEGGLQADGCRYRLIFLQTGERGDATVAQSGAKRHVAEAQLEKGNV